MNELQKNQQSNIGAVMPRFKWRSKYLNNLNDKEEIRLNTCATCGKEARVFVNNSGYCRDCWNND